MSWEPRIDSRRLLESAVAVIFTPEPLVFALIILGISKHAIFRAAEKKGAGVSRGRRSSRRGRQGSTAFRCASSAEHSARNYRRVIGAPTLCDRLFQSKYLTVQVASRTGTLTRQYRLIRRSRLGGKTCDRWLVPQTDPSLSDQPAESYFHAWWCAEGA